MGFTFGCSPILNNSMQWRIQDFPGVFANPKGVGTNLLFGQIFNKY